MLGVDLGSLKEVVTEFKDVTVNSLIFTSFGKVTLRRHFFWSPRWHTVFTVCRRGPGVRESQGVSLPDDSPRVKRVPVTAARA